MEIGELKLQLEELQTALDQQRRESDFGTIDPAVLEAEFQRRLVVRTSFFSSSRVCE